MAPKQRARKPAARKSKPPRAAGRRRQRSGQRKAAGHFVGRAGSPVLDKYPPKAPDAAVGVVPVPPTKLTASLPAPAPPGPTAPALPVPPAGAPPPAGPPSPPKMLISLEKPFDIDDFSQLLGQTQIQVTVPRDSVTEVLRRACEFMDFGIYVYSIRVRPGPEELLKTFVVELQRVDFSPQSKDWTPFQDRGRADSPFGPTGTR